MRSRNLFLLVYFAWGCFGSSGPQISATCAPAGMCEVPNPTWSFLQCVGLPPTDTGRDHIHRLKQILEAAMDVYTFMKSSMKGVPVLSLQGALHLNPRVDPHQNEAVIQMWMEVKLKPLLHSITKHFLSCLSTKNFSCSTYQNVVKELSHHFSEMNPVRQKWIYTFFMYPFLSGDRVDGCVRQNETGEDWLVKNFGAFKAMARLQDFSTLNMAFSGLEVLHLLSPVQKAELLMRPEVASLDNATLTLIFHNLLTGGSNPKPTAFPGGGYNWTSPMYPPTTHNPQLPLSTRNGLREVVNGFMTAFKPIGSFVHEFVTFTRVRNVSEIKSTTFTQFLLNWTLSELADMYRSRNASVAPQGPKFDVTDVEDWYRQVVLPLLRRFLPNAEALMHENIKLAFHQVFYLEHGLGPDEENETSEIQDVCSITLDKAPCGLTDAVVNVAKVLHCAARTNLTMTEANLMQLVYELSGRLNSLVRELAAANFSEVASEFQNIFTEEEPPTLPQEHLNDPSFIALWFKVKLLPLLPAVPVHILSCLSTKNFTCPVFHTIVGALGHHMSAMKDDPKYSHNVYKYLIYQHLWHRNGSDPQCVSSANHSAEWLLDNFGFFSSFASMADFYRLNPNFSGLEVLPHLSPNQTAELLLLPLPAPPEKDVIIDRVFEFLLESPEDRRLSEVLSSLVWLAREVEPPCSTYRHIFERLYKAIPSLPPRLEPLVWAGIDELITITPDECLPANITCLMTQYNASKICRGIHSSDLQAHLNTSVDVPCNFTLETYACAQENFTAQQLASLLKCNLPGNSSHSRMIWKMLLTKSIMVLDPALDILANMSMSIVIPSATEVLDVIREIRLNLLTEEQLRNQSVITRWFSRRLSILLPYASAQFLTCLSLRNLSCHSYQQIMQEFSHHFDKMTTKQQEVVMKDFIKPFLSQSGQRCLSISINSSDWLIKNLGPFSRFLPVKTMLELNSGFNPLEVLQLLTPTQSAELLVLSHPTLDDKDAIINMIFDYLPQSAPKFTHFLSELLKFLPMGNLSCSSYKTLLERLDLALDTVALDVGREIMNTKMALSTHIPPGCVIYSGQCNVTITNETVICAGVNSTTVQLLLDSGLTSGGVCGYPVEELACASLSALKAEDLAALLACNRTWNSSSTMSVWHLLLSKASMVLDQALDLLANKNLDPRNPALTMILDSISQVRLDRLNPSSFNNLSVINLWFNQRLLPFLPGVSPNFLSCLTRKGLDCSTYQHIVQIFSSLMEKMSDARQMSVYNHFIKVHLTRINTTDPGCTTHSSNSSDWLMKNLGPFSRFLPVKTMLELNSGFNPLEVLQLLTPTQSAELLVLSHPTLDDKDAIINMIFDYLPQSAPKVTHFLSELLKFLPMGNLSCSSYKTLFKRLDLALDTVALDVGREIMNTKMALSTHIPPGCVIYSGQCNVTITNETVICAGVNSTTVQLLLDSGLTSGGVCGYPVEELACASLSALKAEDLAALLACNRTWNSSSTMSVWHLLLSKASMVLDQALDLLANKNLDPRNPALTMILDSISQVRLDRLNPSSFNNLSVINLWFNQRLLPFLPGVSPNFLSCLTRKGLDCRTYQHIVQIFSSLMEKMSDARQMSVYNHFIKVHLTRINTTDPGCTTHSSNSSDWLMKNLGPFSRFLPVKTMLELNSGFNPLEVLQLLTPTQSAELLVLSHPTLDDKDAIINMIFDYLPQSAPKVTHFLSELLKFLPMGNLSCSSYKTLFKRLDLALDTVALDVGREIMNTKMALSTHIPPGCVIYSGQCNVTITNETVICAGVNSTTVQLLLDSGLTSGGVCGYPVEELACASLSALKAEDLAALLACNRTWNSSSTMSVWHLLLSKASMVLDQALDLLANKNLDPRNPALTMILDSISQVRLDRLNPSSFNNLSVINLWFNQRLLPFLPGVSPNFLSCLTRKGLDCRTYQHIVQIFSSLMEKMSDARQMSVYNHFIKVHLTRINTTDPGCTTHSSNSSDWLMKNLGPFSRFLPVKTMLELNSGFNPLEVLQLLTPTQSAELLVLSHPTLDDKDAIINMIFDYLPQSAPKVTHFLSELLKFLPMGNLSCSSYKTLFKRLDLALDTVALDVGREIMNTKMALSTHIPPGCVIYSGQCNVTITNETVICAGVNSTTVQLLLDSGLTSGGVCGYPVEELACASLSALKAEDLAALLACNRTWNSSSTMSVWHLLLSKASMVLDQALDLLANKNLDPRNPALTMILDSISQVRLDRLNPSSFNNLSVINLWFNQRLRPFLPGVSPNFLSCLTRKGLDCSTYQHIVQIFSSLMEKMSDARQMSVYNHFIKVYLTRINTTDPGCTTHSSNSSDWLMKNLGPFSRFLPVKTMLELNSGFNPLEVLQLLTPTQSAELLVLSHPTLDDKDAIINMIFDYLPQSAPKVTHFLSELLKFLPMGNLSCSSYKTLLERLDLALDTVALDVGREIMNTKMALSTHIPPGCVIYSGQCNVTITNETVICAGVNSTTVQLLLDSGLTSGGVCGYPVEELACASLSALKAEDLAALLACNRTWNSSSTMSVWHLLLSKASMVLDQALDLLANKNLDPRNPALTMILDSISQVRLDRLNPSSFNNLSVINLWFNQRLRPFLPGVSPNFLSCLTRKGLDCSTYQHIVQIFSSLMEKMSDARQMSVYNHFIKVYLTRINTTDPGCTTHSSNSSDWLMKNLGPFSRFLPVKTMLELNSGFNPLEVLQLLTPTQSAELLVLSHPTLDDKDAIINMIFDYLPQSAPKVTHFLSELLKFLPMGNLSCSSYKTLLERLDLALDTVALDVGREIMNTKMALSTHIPPGCVIYSGQCNVTITNETVICAGVNSTTVQLLLDSGLTSGGVCGYPVEELACASLSALKAEDLAALLACNRTWNSSSTMSVWHLLLSKASMVLDQALDLLANKNLDPRNPALTMILDSISQVRLDRLNSSSFNNLSVINLWFNQRLRPFLPGVSPNFLSCLTRKGLDCSTYQHIVQIFSSLMEKMSDARQMSVYNHFIKVYLTRINTTDHGCRSNNSGEWLQKNLGAFSSLVPFNDIQMLFVNFSVMDALPHLTVRQLAEVSSTPGQLRSAAQVNMVMSHVQNQQLPTFFDYFSPAIMLHQNSLQPAVIPAMLQVVFDKANLSDPSVSDSVVWQWLHVRLQPLLFNLSPDHVAPFFSIIMGRNCSIQLQGVQDLNSTISSLSENAQTEIHNHIIQMLKGPKPLQCYGDNYNNSFYTFVENSFMGFKFPNVTAYLSLMPNNRRHQLINSMPPSHLGDFLRRPDVVDDNAELCLIYGSYTKTPLFLETEALPAVVRRPTLPCVWPMALSSSKRSEVNRWFDQSLKNYLVFLRKSLISPSVTYNSSCLAFQKLVSVLGEFNYTTVDFMKPDMYSSIRTYLTSANLPRCYDASDPELNSTAWFAEYIGPFLQFLSLEDFQAFGSAQFIQVFTVNLVNIALLNQTTLPLNLSNYYTQLVYQQDSNFNPIHLPLQYRCVAPGPAFTQLNPQQTLMVFYNLTTVCIDLDPQVSAALAGNLGQNINANAIVTLGNQSSSLSTGQIMTMKPEDLVKALSTLGSVSTWNQGQANGIIQKLLSSGMMKLNSSSSLVQLGSLVIGIPSKMFSSISGMELLTASKNPSVVSHMVSAPQIVQQTFVAQITAVNSSSDAIAENVPDELASEISRVLLLDFSNNVNIFQKLNRKKWKRQQVELFFSLIAAENSTTTLGGANNLSSSMLQGFSCLSVSTLKRAQVKRLIGACRRKGRDKVPLVETQLTCMYNYIRNDSDVTSFDLYPPDMLLYYDYSLVPQNRCRDYFTQLAEADFSIFSTSLSYKKSALLTNARSCLGITNTILNRDTVAVLGNMCCILDGSYIENSDPSILENLNNCADLTSGQVTAVEALLQSGRTQHGAPSTWNEQTLKDLGMLPLYLTSTFYENFDRKTKRDFKKYFMKVLKNNKVSRQKREQFTKEMKKSLKKKAKRSTTIECTTGNITQVTISDNAFPFDYDDINQFNACLSAQTVKDNLAAIMEKVDLDEYLSIVLSKLREAYSSHSTIAESQVQLLGAASRMASSIDINMWNISEVDTLSALMDSSDGEWEPSRAKAIISKYLSVGGNKLGTAELNSIGGPNLCSLDTNVLSTISAQSIKNANALDISNCTSEKKRVLFTIADQAFTTTTRSTTISPTNYLLLKSYLPGANLNFIRSLSTANINMDMSTFTSLQENVVLNLTVSEVQNLLGSNLNDLKLYENETLVRSWTSLQLQSELDRLGLGLTGGRSSPTTPSGTTATVNPNAVTSTAAPTVTNTASSTPTTRPTAATTTGSNGSRIHSDVGLFSLLLLSVFIISQHLLV